MVDNVDKYIEEFKQKKGCGNIYEKYSKSWEQMVRLTCGEHGLCPSCSNQSPVYEKDGLKNHTRPQQMSIPSDEGELRENTASLSIENGVPGDTPEELSVEIASGTKSPNEFNLEDKPEVHGCDKRRTQTSGTQSPQRVTRRKAHKQELGEEMSEGTYTLSDMISENDTLPVYRVKEAVKKLKEELIEGEDQAYVHKTIDIIDKLSGEKLI